jgi:hypothetical protein
MVARRAEGTGRLRRCALSGGSARQLVVDIAALVLPSDQILRRIIPTAERTVPRGGDKK